jgi:hypothetical protein
MSEEKPKQPNPKFKLLDGHQMRFSFELDGVEFYEFSDSKMAPCHRMFAAMDFYNEFQMRCTRDYLLGHSEAVKTALNGKSGTIDLIAVSTLYTQLTERLEWIFEPESAYKYASVIFIDENESPYSYDHKYNREKIARWKKHAPADFFLSMPVERLFPPLSILKSDFQDYLKVLKMMDRKHLETIFTILSSDQKTKGWYNSLELLNKED